jgi:hypothetical protein
MRALLAVVAPAMLMTGFATAPATAAPAPAPAPAEVGCTSFTSVHYFAEYYLHVPSVGSGSWNFNCVLARGSNNVGVLALQESLNVCYQRQLGLAPIATDGDFGGNTEQAVRNAQNRINQDYNPDVLSVDGRFGPITSSYFAFQTYDHLNGGAHTGWCATR